MSTQMAACRATMAARGARTVGANQLDGRAVVVHGRGVQCPCHHWSSTRRCAERGLARLGLACGSAANGSCASPLMFFLPAPDTPLANHVVMRARRQDARASRCEPTVRWSRRILGCRFPGHRGQVLEVSVRNRTVNAFFLGTALLLASALPARAQTLGAGVSFLGDEGGIGATVDYSKPVRTLSKDRTLGWVADASFHHNGDSIEGFSASVNQIMVQGGVRLGGTANEKVSWHVQGALGSGLLGENTYGMHTK